MAEPTYEYSDDPFAYRAERDAHAAARAQADAIAAGIINAIGCVPKGQYLPTREVHEHHLMQVERFVRGVRSAMVKHPRWLAPMISQSMARAGVTLGEVLAAADLDEDHADHPVVCAWCDCEAEWLTDVDGDVVCGPCIDAQHALVERNRERACACGNGGQCGECTGVRHA